MIWKQDPAQMLVPNYSEQSCVKRHFVIGTIPCHSPKSHPLIEYLGDFNKFAGLNQMLFAREALQSLARPTTYEVLPSEKF